MHGIRVDINPQFLNFDKLAARRMYLVGDAN